MTDREEISSVWIKTEPDLEGIYHVVLELSADDVVPLDTDAAYGWAREVLSAVAQAEYDAAVLEQATTYNLGDKYAAMLVIEMRKTRERWVPVGAVPGLALVPGVSQQTRKGFLRLDRRGEPLGQWELDEARQHALAVIEAFEVAQLDTAYRAVLREMGLDEDRARAAVGDLIRHRP